MLSLLAAAIAVAAPAPAPHFDFRVQPPPRRRMVGVSWREGCPVALRRLRYLELDHWSFRGREKQGEMVVHRDAVPAMRLVFRTLFRHRFPIRRMRLVDDYGGSDFDSIEADNSSAFNCRNVAGSDRWSQHAYGRAIDVNPIENPYVHADGTTSHPASEPYVDRTRRRKGMARRRGVLVKAFKRAGWAWGGLWSPARDYQHFSATGT